MGSCISCKMKETNGNGDNVVIPPLSEVERFVEESADRESVVVREIIFSNSTTQVI